MQPKPRSIGETDTLAGYRLVRKLGAGTRAEIFLGVAVSDETSSPRTAALKIFRPKAPREDIGRELATLGRVELAHCVRLIDVATAENGMPVPILRRVQRGSVAQLLRDRESLEAGEAVTLLAPLPETMNGLHALGIAHANLGASSVHLGAAGEPVLLGFGHASSFEAGLSIAALDRESAVLADRDRLAALVEVVLGHVRRGERTTPVADLLVWLAASGGSREFEFALELQDRLFDLAEPLPIEFARVGAAGSSVPSRIGEPTAESSPGTDAAPRPGDGEAPAPTAVRSSPIPNWMREAILSNPVTLVRSRVLKLVHGVRRPLWIATGAIAVALVLAIAFVPQRAASTSSDRSPATPRATSSATHSALRNDPVLALPLLLSARNECFHDLSVLCLDVVDEQSSAALNDDAGLIRRIQSGQQIPASANITAQAPILVERLGDSALVDLHAESGPASVLMIKGEAGWRIRGFLDEKPVAALTGAIAIAGRLQRPIRFRACPRSCRSRGGP